MATSSELPPFLLQTPESAPSILPFNHALLDFRYRQIGHATEKIAASPAPGAENITPISEARALFAKAQKEALRIQPADEPLDAVSSLLICPPIGGWAAFILSNREARKDSSEYAPPQWVHDGYFNCIAAVAAISAGVDFEITVPKWNNKVVLPSFTHGMLDQKRYPEPTWGTAKVSGEGDTITIADEHNRIVASRNKKVLEVLRNYSLYKHNPDLTVSMVTRVPYRSFEEPYPPDLYGFYSDEMEDFNESLNHGFQLLLREHPKFAQVFLKTVVAALPDTRPSTATRFRPRSGSGGTMIGAIEFNPAHDVREMACTMVHEGYHNYLNLKMLETPLFQRSPERPERQEILYAPWRDDPRHAFGLLHGVVSFLAVTRFWQERIRLEYPDSEEKALAQFELAHWRQQLPIAAQQLVERAHLFTDEGRNFLHNVLLPDIASLQCEEVPPSIQKLADISVQYHRAMWKAHHIKLEVETVDKFAQNWIAKLPRPSMDVAAAQRLEPEPRAWLFDTWAVLARLSLAEPNTLAKMHRDPTNLHLVEGADSADVNYFMGNIDEAMEQYLTVLTSWKTLGTLDEPAAIVGLGHTIDDPAAKHTLLYKPHLFREVRARIAALTKELPDPIVLARWLG